MQLKGFPPEWVIKCILRLPAVVLDELVLHANDGELEVAEDDLALQEEHIALKTVPFVKVLSWQISFRCPWW